MASKNPLFEPSELEVKARKLLALHTKPHPETAPTALPLLLLNVWDASTAEAIASLPATTALASASFAVAAINGLDDADLDGQTNLAALRIIGRVAHKHNLPFTADMQHGYGSRLEEFFERAIREAGVVGCNMEDLLPDESGLLSIEEACDRIARVRRLVTQLGVPSFVINARCDVLNRPDGTIEETQKRCLAYLEAGASIAFAWRKGPGLPREEVIQLVKALPAGKFNTQVRKGGLSVKEMGELGVCRLSAGPGLFNEVAAVMKSIGNTLQKGGKL